MGISRLEFLKGALAAFGFGALGGRRIFAVPSGWKPDGRTPNIVFGVISDTHIRTDGRGEMSAKSWTTKYFREALEHFKREGADAVVHCGDMAHRGQILEMQAHADAWKKVFPSNKGKGGRTVAKLFVTGNHDVEGDKYGGFVEGIFPDPKERAKHVLNTDMAKNWEKIWREKYEPLWHKEVKGYHFFGQNFGVPDEDAIAFLKERGAELRLAEGDRPFFFMRHRRPYADIRKKGLRPLRNSISFFGHNHWSAANWNMAYLYYGCLPVIEVPSCEPRGCVGIADDGWITEAKIEGRDAENVGKGRQAYVVRVYDDMMVIERRDFTDGAAPLGADWVMTLGGAQLSRPLVGRTVPSPPPGGSQSSATEKRPHSFSREELKKAIGEPQFRDGAKLMVSFSSHKEQKKQENPSPAPSPSPVSSCSLWLKIPLADGNHASRVYAYEAVVVGRGALGATRPTNQAAANGTGGSQFAASETDATKRVPPKLRKAIYAAGVNVGVGREPNKGVTTLEIPEAELPPGDALTVAVRPLSSLGTSGKPISAIWRRKG